MARGREGRFEQDRGGGAGDTVSVKGVRPLPRFLLHDTRQVVVQRSPLRHVMTAMRNSSINAK